MSRSSGLPSKSLAERLGWDRPISSWALRKRKESSFDTSRPAISQHLRILLDAGLVTERREGRERRYRLRPERLQEVEGWLQQYERFWRRRLGALGEYLENNP